MNIKKAEHEFVILLDNKLLIDVSTYSVSKKKELNEICLCVKNPELEALLTNNPLEASVFDENKT
ncbi:hypothetical protein C2G38_2171897 [Gigaspora rosea]|uniref:Uncharacterized protein n=1 Tax=Gigaspora rosea TaxID=44941 RepID=A0A397VL71_9GLOM|nr:hypothetical protein C2G38_2171897 [Gigaspora rosea]